MKIKPKFITEDLHKAINQWGCNYLVSLGHILKNDLPEVVQDTPWSYVVRFKTPDGDIYLKHTPKLLALEATITQILHDQFQASVPTIIAHNTHLDCFLMKDAGIPLRKQLQLQFDAELFSRAIEEFTSLQLAVSNHINVFLDIGVPDWRLDKLADLYLQILSRKDLLIADGLEEYEIDELKALYPVVSDLCKKLASYNIKPSLVQPDFHDNNILRAKRSKKLTFIDLGEVAISHPFFSLINCLYQAKKHHGLVEVDDSYQQLRKACFKNFAVFEPEKRLEEAFEIARILDHVYGTLCGYRFMIACGEARILAFQPGKFSATLKTFMSEVNKGSLL